MNLDCLKLTIWFGERDRTDGDLLGDALLDIYGRERLEASILLRGAEGFGRRQQLRTDRLVSLAEDLPVISVAVDGRERIESMLELVRPIEHHGLITLERARMLRGQIDATGLARCSEEEMKLTFYIGRRERIGRTLAYLAICDLLYRAGIAGASVLPGVDGTRAGLRRRARFFGRNADVPMMVVAVGAGATLARLAAQIGALLREPLMTLERVRVCKRDGRVLKAPYEPTGRDEHGRAIWQKLTVYSDHHAMHGKYPIHHAIVRGLRESGAAGVTVVNGVWGFHGEQAPHGDRFLQVVRRVPVCTIAIDSPERIARSFQIIDEMTAEQGLVTSELVPAIPLGAGDPKVA